MGISRLYCRLAGVPYYRKKRVLVLEGGGMRGIFLAGVLQSFHDRGYFPWKLVIGSSAGALVGASYAAGQLHLARDAYLSGLSAGKVIHISNILRTDRHVLDLDWMVDNVIKGDEPLDIRRLKRSARVLITATDCRPHNPPRTVYLSSRTDDVATSLKATAAIPFLYRGFVRYNRYQMLDGGLLDPIPYKKALSMGYREDEIVVVLTRARGYRKKEESFWIRTLYEFYYRDPQYRYLVESIDNRFLLYNRILEELENRYTGIDVIYPPAGFRVERLTRDEKKILRGFEFGISAGKQYLKSIHQ